MNYLTAREYAILGVPVGRMLSADDFDLGPTEWITYEQGRWRWNSASGARPLTFAELTADDYMAGDWVTPREWGDLPRVTPQPDFPENQFTKESPTFDVMNPRKP